MIDTFRHKVKVKKQKRIFLKSSTYPSSRTLRVDTRISWLVHPKCSLAVAQAGFSSTVSTSYTRELRGSRHQSGEKEENGAAFHGPIAKPQRRLDGRRGAGVSQGSPWPSLTNA